MNNLLKDKSKKQFDEQKQKKAPSIETIIENFLDKAGIYEPNQENSKINNLNLSVFVLALLIGIFLVFTLFKVQKQNIIKTKIPIQASIEKNEQEKFIYNQELENNFENFKEEYGITSDLDSKGFIDIPLQELQKFNSQEESFESFKNKHGITNINLDKSLSLPNKIKAEKIISNPINKEIPQIKTEPEKIIVYVQVPVKEEVPQAVKAEIIKPIEASLNNKKEEVFDPEHSIFDKPVKKDKDNDPFSPIKLSNNKKAAKASEESLIPLFGKKLISKFTVFQTLKKKLPENSVIKPNNHQSYRKIIKQNDLKQKDLEKELEQNSMQDIETVVIDYEKSK